MNEAMRLGLQKSTSEKSSIKMFPSYVTRTRNGTETGNYLALDLGGTNYRVLAVTLEGLTHATLLRWTKGFSASGVEGHNVAELLQVALDQLGLNVKCVAVVNDTIGTLASCALENPKCAVGLIAGTGTKVAYIEDASKVELMTGVKEPEVVINTEYGAFGQKGELNCWRTQFDKCMDAESLHPGKQLYEKMVSGIYLGELVRHILVYLVEQNILFRGKLPER
uniref:Phosphotransferase n=1 Tax=Trichobilharzia regenti TaxID=157069 RepID=A0AA85IZ87_TRIRE|nr:unnamed protein product [Trichobilharzia regenti]